MKFYTFFLSLFLSPVIGLIIAIVSGENINSKVPTSAINMDLAKKAEHREDYEEAIRFYSDAIYDMKNSPKAQNKYLLKSREAKMLEAKSKIIELKKRIRG